MSGREETDVEEALEEAARAGLVHEIGSDTYGFDHTLTQEAVYMVLPSRRKSRLHLAAGEAMEQSRGGYPPGVARGLRPQPDRPQKRAPELAWHFMRGRDTARALRYYTLSGDEAETLFAHEEAEGHYGTALDLARELGDTGAEAEALEKLGGVNKMLGHYDGALEMLEEAAGHYAELRDVEGERRTVAQIGEVHSKRGSFAEGVARLQKALATVGRGVPTEGLAAIYVELAFLFFDTGRYGEQLAEAERACEVAEAVHSDRLLAQGELARGYALVWTEGRAQFRSAMERVVELGEKIGDLPTAALALGALVGPCADAGELEKARTYAERALEIQERMGDRSRIAFASFVRGWVGYWSGDWDGAHADFERSLELYRDVGAGEHAMIPMLGVGMVRMGRGDWEAGAKYLEKHIAIGHRTGDLKWVHWAQILLAERDIQEGRAQAAQTRLKEALELPGLTEIDKAEVRVAVAWALLDLGDEVQAAELVERALRQVQLQGNHRVSVEALRVQGMVRARQGRWEDTSHSFESVLALSSDTVFPYPRARALYEYGAALGRQGEKELARARLTEALIIFQRLDASRDVERTRKALAG
jgi:tetratricopeptide (TPR) repeat protein